MFDGSIGKMKRWQCGGVTTTAGNDLIVALFNIDPNASPAGIAPAQHYRVLTCVGGTNGTCAAQDGSANQLGAMIGRVAYESDSHVPGFASGPGGPNSQSICVVAAFKAESN